MFIKRKALLVLSISFTIVVIFSVLTGQFFLGFGGRVDSAVESTKERRDEVINIFITAAKGSYSYTRSWKHINCRGTQQFLDSFALCHASVDIVLMGEEPFDNVFKLINSKLTLTDEAEFEKKEIDAKGYYTGGAKIKFAMSQIMDDEGIIVGKIIMSKQKIAGDVNYLDILSLPTPGGLSEDYLERTGQLDELRTAEAIQDLSISKYVVTFSYTYTENVQRCFLIQYPCRTLDLYIDQ